METVKILVLQVLQMFLLVGIGCVLFHTKKINQEGSRMIGNILIYVVLPCVIINSFQLERTPERIRELLISAGIAAVLIALAVLVSRILFRKDPIAHFASSFSNPGFFGIPLIVATIGQESVFYVAFFIAFLNIMQWTYGVSLLENQPVLAGFKPGKLIKAPFVIAMIIGLTLFFSGLRLPSLLSSSLATISALNTPLSMFTIGVYLAQTNVLGMLKKPSLYLVSLSRLVVVPILAVLLLSFLPESIYPMKLALLIGISCPVGANVAVYAQLHNQNYTYAVETVIISTLFSILSIPAIVSLAHLIW